MFRPRLNVIKKMNRTTVYFHSWLPIAVAFLFPVFLLSPTYVLAQENKTQPLVTVTLKERPFSEAMTIIEYRIPYKFAYSTELARRQKNVSITAVKEPLADFMRRLLEGRAVSWHLFGDQIVLQNSMGSSTMTLNGYVTDAGSGESLIGATVYLPASGAGVLSNDYGFYSITLPTADSVDVAVSYVGYKTLYSRVSTVAGTSLSLALQRDDSLEAINKLTVIRDAREDNVRKNQTALIDLSHDMIAAAPSLSGTGDVINSVEMLPGVQSGIDGSPGYFVRGGNPGQNLILLDDATLYNPSHIFGLVGIFNPLTIKHASLMKGGFPASYGDHISSVLDVAMKDGSNQQPGGTVQMGSVSSGLTLYGPLQFPRSSFLISARRSTADIVLHPLLRNNFFNHYYFYDVNAKLNFVLSPKDRLLLSFYAGRDNNTYSSDSSTVSGIDYAMHFGNTAFTLRWNHQYSATLFAHSSIEYNKYHQFLSARQEGYFAQLYSGIRDVNAKSELNWYFSPVHKFSGGADLLYQTLNPASLSGIEPRPGPQKTIVPSGIPSKTAVRIALYASDDIKPGDRWQFYAGVRAPFYDKPGAHYLSVEPRLSLLYLIDPETSIKLSYTSMHQYIHLVQSYNASFPAEIWIGSSDSVRPQSSHEISLGLYKNFSANSFQASLELYYKKMGDQLLFGGGSDSQTIDNTIQKQLIFGKGWSYGAELFVRKNRGRWTGWLAYTLAYAYQQFDSLNEGQTFPFAYDRRNMVNLSVAYSVSPHWKIGANFLIASGRAFSLSPDSSYIIDPGPGHNPLYDDPRKKSGPPGPGQGQPGGPGANRDGSWDIVANNYRLSPYNRLDLDAHYVKARTIGHRTLTTEWIFSIYNVYARSNNSLVYRTIDPATRTVVAKQLPLIPIIPSITYCLSF